MNIGQTPLFAFFAVSATIAGLGLLIHDLFLRHREQVRERLADEFGGGTAGSTAKTSLFKDLSRLARDADIDRETGWARWERIVEQADLSLTLRQLLGVCVMVGGTGAAAVVAWTGIPPWGILALVVGGLAPLGYALVRRNQRLEKLRLQLPDAFELMSRSIRAGHTVSRAFHLVAEDFDPPLADEFAWCYEQQNLGLPQELALRDLARRTGVTELQMLVVALLVQRQSGGSPVELLDNLAALVRKRIRLREKVKGLTAEGRMQALILLCLPPLVLGVISVTNPDYVSKLWTRPGLMWSMAGMEMVGALWIRRIISFKY
jgi:tight adherence protein B